MDIIHRPVIYLKHDISDTGFCLHLQVEPTQLRPIYRTSLCLCDSYIIILSSQVYRSNLINILYINN
jgi:hypothetical protein